MTTLDIYRPQQHWGEGGLWYIPCPRPTTKAGGMHPTSFEVQQIKAVLKFCFSMRMQRMQQKEAIMYDGLNTYLL